MSNFLPLAPSALAGHSFCIFFGRERGQKRPFLCTSFCRIFANRPKLRPNIHISSLKNLYFSRARLRRALATCPLIFLAQVVAENRSFLCTSFCHILRYRGKFRPKTHTRSLKNANFSRARLRRALEAFLLIFFGRERGQKSALFVCVILPHFAITGRI